MPLVQDVLGASGSTGIEKVLPAALAANFQAAGFIFTNLELWTDPTGNIQRNLRQILHYLHLLPELSDVTMDHALSWLTHKTGVHYRELMPKMLPPSTTPSPAATPPTPPTTYTSILNSPMPAEARNIRPPRPVQASSTASLPTTSSRPRSDQIPSKAVLIRIHHRPTTDPKTKAVSQPEQKVREMYLRTAGIPESMINTVRRSYLTNIIYDLRIFFSTIEAAQAFYAVARKKISGAKQQSMFNPSEPVYVNVFYYTDYPTHQAAYHAVRSGNKTFNIEERLAALEITDQLDQASKTASKSLHQARSFAKKVQAVAAHHPTDHALATACRMRRPPNYLPCHFLRFGPRAPPMPDTLHAASKGRPLPEDPSTSPLSEPAGFEALECLARLQTVFFHLEG